MLTFAMVDGAKNVKRTDRRIDMLRFQDFKIARMVKLVDTRDLKSLALTGVPVRFRFRAPIKQGLTRMSKPFVF